MDSEKSGRHDAEQLFRRLFEISRGLVVSLDLDGILQGAVDGVATVAGLDTAAVDLLNGSVLRLHATMPPLPPPDFPDGLRYADLKITLTVQELLKMVQWHSLKKPFRINELISTVLMFLKNRQAGKQNNSLFISSGRFAYNSKDLNTLCFQQK